MRQGELFSRKVPTSEGLTAVICFKDCIGLYCYLKDKLDIPEFNAYQSNSLNNLMLTNIVDYFLKNLNGRKRSKINYREVSDFLNECLQTYQTSLEDFKDIDHWITEYHYIISNFLLGRYREYFGNTVFLGYWDDRTEKTIINRPKGFLHCVYVYTPEETFQTHLPWNENYLLFIKRLKEI